MNSWYLKDPEVQELIWKGWSLWLHLIFFGKVRRCVKKYKRYYINKANEKRLREDQLRKQLDKTIAVLQVDPFNAGWQRPTSLV
jgi:hypothetical protein